MALVNYLIKTNKEKKQNKKKKQNINFIVINITKNGNIKNSKPCFKCIEYMMMLDEYTNYKINYVYYSSQDNIIKKVKLKDLDMEENKHVSSRFKRRY